MGYSTEFEGEFKLNKKLDKETHKLLADLDNNIDSFKDNPGFRCDWTPSDDGKYIHWNGSEKFYEYIAWIEFILDRILLPRGYTLNGVVTWHGESSGDIGRITATGKAIEAKRARISY